MSTPNFPGANLDTFGMDNPVEDQVEDVVEPTEDVVDDPNVDDQVDDVVEDGAEDAEDDVEEVGDEFEIAVPIKTLDGKDTEVTLKSEELSNLVSRGYHFDGLLQKATEMDAQLRQNSQLVQFVTQDPVTSMVVAMRARGFSTGQIVQQIATMFPDQQQAEETQGFEYNEEELDPNVRALIAAERKRFDELNKKVNSFETEKAQQATLQHNNQVFDRAIAALGVDFDESPDSYRKLQSVMTELYPGLDIRTARLTERQAQAIISQAGFRQRNRVNAAKQKAAQVAKAKKAPRIVSGVKPTSGTPRSQAPRKNGYTGDERLANLHKLGL